MDPYKVLIADDDEMIRKLIGHLLKSFDLTVMEAGDGKEALSIIEKEKPDILITDVDMPYINGFELCKKVKENKEFGFVYIIIVTGSSVVPEDRKKGFDFGADDYVCKPFHNKEFLGRIKSALRIKKLHDEVFQLSITDELTSLYNRRYFNQLAENEFARAERYEREISCIIIDIDHFKKINDIYGHEGGDYILKGISEILKDSVRKTDNLCRWGGEEFIILLTETGKEGAETTAEHFRRKIENVEFNYKGNKISLTISVGFASLFNGPVRKSRDLITYADMALYEAKKEGRNCIRQITE